jgi:hypothetical protein
MPLAAILSAPCSCSFWITHRAILLPFTVASLTPNGFMPIFAGICSVTQIARQRKGRISAAPLVLSRCYRLKMIWVDATSNAAKMIYLHTAGYWPLSEFIGYSAGLTGAIFYAT